MGLAKEKRIPYIIMAIKVYELNLHRHVYYLDDIFIFVF
jgi:hypothetical protein